jgi:hypothetical protein
MPKSAQKKRTRLAVGYSLPKETLNFNGNMAA